MRFSPRTREARREIQLRLSCTTILLLSLALALRLLVLRLLLCWSVDGAGIDPLHPDELANCLCLASV